MVAVVRRHPEHRVRDRRPGRLHRLPGRVARGGAPPRGAAAPPRRPGRHRCLEPPRVQELLQDYVSGYYILLERHIRVGDRIVLDGHTGDVVEVKLRVTLVRTEGGDLLVVPNSELFTKPVLVRAKGSPEAHAAKEAEGAKPSERQG
ncbi:MAG: mechanosensitive ion channel [Chloroflexi bacterium]|nr:MAG: mechanosensitive ion channel [Chloroflexota bacterium]